MLKRTLRRCFSLVWIKLLQLKQNILLFVLCQNAYLSAAINIQVCVFIYSLLLFILAFNDILLFTQNNLLTCD